MSIDIKGILDDCIDRLKSGESLQSCLARYPECAAELEPLLQMAEATLKLAKIGPNPTRKDAAKRRFLELAQEPAQAATDKRDPLEDNLIVFPFRRRTVAACFAAALILTLAMVGSVVVSAESTPDDPLYSVKRAAERIRLLLAHDDDVASLHMELADKRLDELEIIASRRGTVRTSLLVEVVRETGEALTGLETADNKEKLGEELIAVTSHQQEVLRKVAASAPEEAKDSLEKALEQSRRGYSAASTAVARERSGDRKGEAKGDDDDDDDKLRQVTPSATSKSSPFPTFAQATATAEKLLATATAERSDDDDGGDADDGEEVGTSQERERTPTARAATPTRSPERGEPTSQPTVQASPTRTATARPQASPTRTATARPQATSRAATATATPIRRATETEQRRDSSDDDRKRSADRDSDD